MLIPIGLTNDADGTAQRESLRRWHMGLVIPVGRLIAHELAVKLERPCSLWFDPYPMDMQTRVGQLEKLVGLGVGLSAAARVLGIEGL